MGNASKSKMRWYNLAMMGFMSVWGFGNIVNNYANQGLRIVVSWILIMSLYFIPYVLMVGELGSVFNKTQSGLGEWIKETSFSKNASFLAYLAGWTYWVVHIPYIARKPHGVLISLSWVLTGSGELIKKFSSSKIQILCLIIFLIFMYFSSRGVNSLKKLATIAGSSMFIMSILYIILMIAATFMVDLKSATPNLLAMKNFIPKFDLTYFATLSMLVFAVGGCEKLSPYVSNCENPTKEFPRAMILLAIMVIISAVLGSVAMGMMFNSNAIPKDLKMNGSYYSFKLLGQYYGLGNFFLILYAAAVFTVQISGFIIAIDAPLKVLLSEADERYIPKALAKKNKNGVLINGYKLTAVLVGILMLIPALGIGDFNNLFTWLLDLNSIVMPMRYLWVFFAYICLRKNEERFDLQYKAFKNRKFALILGGWCFFFTAFACIMGVIPKGAELFSGEWYFKLALNIGTPFVLLGLGLILPIIARKTNGKVSVKDDIKA